MEKIHQQLLTYCYNITGSYEDSRDLVQDVFEKYIQVDKTAIQNEKNYLIRSVINHSINYKKRQKKMVSYGTPLPEPVSNEFMLVNHQPSLVYYKGEQIISCQFLEIEAEKIYRIYSVVDRGN
jgi:DNA-directed RNA polymerase specialized sigma24 family protein